MGTARPALPQSENCRAQSIPWNDNERINVGALIEENAQLRELVIQLSKLVIKNAIDKK